MRRHNECFPIRLGKAKQGTTFFLFLHIFVRFWLFFLFLLYISSMVPTMSPGEQLAAVITALATFSLDVPFFNVTVPVLDVLHALLINYIYRSALGGNHSRIGWGQGFLATIVMCAGGGSTVALLRGEPLGILMSNSFWVIYG